MSKLLMLTLAVVLAAGSAQAQTVKIVAAENFYGDIARQIGGADVEVESILSNPNQDPHQFEASPSVARDVADAQVIILNGAGYDPWMERLLEGGQVSGRHVINVAALTGRKEGDNPHLWYDLAAARALTKELANELAVARPEAADRFRQRENAFSEGLHPIQDAIAAVAQHHSGAHVAATEPVFGYMLDGMGLAVQEQGFQLAAMNEVEPSVSDIARFEADLKSKAVKLLVHNAQTSGPLAEKMMSLAQASGIPVVGVTETMPPGKTYQTWIADEIAAVAKALEASP